MKRPPPPSPEELRQEALRRLAAAQQGGALATPDASKLMQELEIHRIELESQNEQLRLAQQELEAGLDRYTQLFDFAPIGYATLGADGTVREVNHVGATLLREMRSTIVSRRFALFLAAPHRAPFAALLRAVVDEDAKKTSDMELVYASLEPKRPWVRITMSSLAGAEPTVLLAFEDVTLQKRAETTLRRADEALREADRRKDEFLAVLSHELRTPLSSVLLHAQLLQQRGLDKGAAVHSGEVIERAVKEQSRLVDDLLDLSGIVAGKLTLTAADTNLEAPVRAAVEAVCPRAQEKKIQLQLVVDGQVATTAVDAARVQQAVQNLITNAVKFTPEGGRIQVSLAEIDGRARIEVRDTGQGIDAALLPLLFDRFFQADRSSTRSTGGLGLGLSIARSIVEAHHGTLKAESAGKGQGAKFTILLPIVSRGASAPLPERTAKATSLRGARLLVVEDDDGTRATLTKVFERAGATVRDAESGAAAMKVLARFKPDLLVCDIAMPDEGGCSLLRRIRRRGKRNGGDVGALALTAFADEGARARTREAGFQDHLVKPVDVDRLLDAVSTLLPSKRGSAARAR
jgi:signal transduction histidine kinase/ActR/RegA family two-component response regulator